MATRKFEITPSQDRAHGKTVEHSTTESLEWVRQLKSSISDARVAIAAKEEFGVNERVEEQGSEVTNIDPDRTDNLTRLKHDCARLKRVTGFLVEAEQTLDERISKRGRTNIIPGTASGGRSR